MPFEAFGWPDSVVYASTGVAFATSAIIGLAEQTTVNRQYAWVNTVASNGRYYNHITGQRADVNIGQIYSYDKTLEKIAELQTALHMKLVYTGANGTAGIFLYSGQIQSLNIVGAPGQLFKATFAAFFNNWQTFP